MTPSIDGMVRPEPGRAPRDDPFASLAAVRRPEPGARRSGPAQLGRRPAVRPARGDRREHRTQRRSRGTARVRRPRPDRGAPRQRRDGLPTDFPDPKLLTPGQWAHETLEAYRPLFTELATSLGAPAKPDTTTSDPMAQMMAGISRMLAPAMLGMAVGSMVGKLAQRAFGLARPADPPRPARDRAGRRHDRRLRRLVGDPDRRDAAVGPRPRVVRTCAVLGAAHPRTPHRPGPSPRRRRSGPTPRRSPTSSPTSRCPTTTRFRRCSRRSAIRRCCSVRCDHPTSWRSSRRSTPPWQRWSATPTGSSMRSRCG